MAECEYEGCRNDIYLGGLCTVHTTDNGSQTRSFEVERFEKDFLCNIFSQLILENNNLDFDEFYRYCVGGYDEVLESKYGLLVRYSFIKISGVFFSALNDDLCVLAFSHLKRFDYVSFVDCKFDRLRIYVFGEFFFNNCDFLGCLIFFYEYRHFFKGCRFKCKSYFFLSREEGDKGGVKIDIGSFFDRECSFHGELIVDQQRDWGCSDSVCGFLPRKTVFVESKITLHDIVFSDEFKPEDMFFSFQSISSTNIGFFNCIFRGRFEINERSFFSFESVLLEKVRDLTRIGSLLMKDVLFEDKFEIKSQFVNSISMDNVTFVKVVDFNKTFFLDFCGERVDFKDFFAFEDVQVLNARAVFKYATFHAHATFRGAKFLGGLDLDRANFSGEANFLGVDADGSNIKNTTRETYRLIKHSFDKIGNHLEANKFFAKEMDKYREEVSGNKSLPWWDRAVFHINKNVSDFGQNYLLSIGWLLLAMVFYFYAFVLHRHMGWLHTESSCNVLDNAYDNLNCLASGMIPFKGFLTNGMELLSLVFYIIFAVLVWQTVVALKRHTRR